jgi:Immunity protein 35
MNYEKAKTLAQIWIELNNSVDCEIIDDETISKPYGWVFFYQSKSYLETLDFSEQLLGNAPILIDRFDGELRVFGTAESIENYLFDYEKTIPQVRLKMKPEFPSN